VAKPRRDRIEGHTRKLAEEGPECVCFNIRKAARAVTQLYDDAFRPTGLRATQLSILAVTNGLGPMTVTRLAQATVTDRTTLTRNLNLLEKRGLIRTREGNDRRERQVTLTDRGREILAKAYPFWQKAQARIVKGLGEERWKPLREGLAAIVSLTRES
jgi:DNA-binding MarR family transcriptional regulator